MSVGCGDENTIVFGNVCACTMKTRLLAVAGITCIAFSAIFVRLADVSPATAAFFRSAYALPLLYLLYRGIRHRDHRPAAMRWLAFGAGILLAVDLTLWHQSIALIGAGLATVLGNTQVLFVGVAAWILYRERPTWLALLLLPVLCHGILLISGVGAADSYGEDPARGAILGIGTGFFYALFLLTMRASNRNLAPAVGPWLDATMGAAVASAAIGLFTGTLELSIPWRSHLWLMALAWFVQVLGWLLISRALPRLPALETSVLLPLQPAGTVLAAYLLLAENLSRLQWIGAGLVVGGIGTVLLHGAVRHRHDEPIAEADEEEFYDLRVSKAA